jgi:uncharacterized membrane protein
MALQAPSPLLNGIHGRTTQPTSIPEKTWRVESIDLLRGLVMVIMALDHVRDYFHADAFVFSPTDLSRTNTALFFTRWITHFCAPAFMFLSGTSAFLIAQRKGRAALSRFLLTRGLWLIFLEFTVVNFAWFFEPSFPMIAFLVIWALGISMIALAGLIWLPLEVILGISLVMILGHNLLDGVNVDGNGINAFIWALLHKMQGFQFLNRTVFVAYPMIPWIGVMSLGYCLGRLYTRDYDAAKRKTILLWSGTISVAVFVVLRYTNVYGDPFPWSEQPAAGFTVLSFFNTTKYPPSLLYLLMTLGPSLIFLSVTERSSGWLSDKIKTIGRVPMFYYLIHIYVIHLGALLAAELSGFGWRSMILETWISFDSRLAGYGFSLGVTYLVWLSIVILLYFLCRWYDGYKRANADKWWLSYL